MEAQHTNLPPDAIDEYRGRVKVAAFELWLHGDGAVSVVAEKGSPIKPGFALALSESRRLTLDIRLPFLPLLAKVHPEDECSQA